MRAISEVTRDLLITEDAVKDQSNDMSKKEEQADMSAVLGWFAPFRTFFGLDAAEKKVDTLRASARDRCYAG